MHPGARKTQQDLIKFQFALPADEWIIQLVPEDENGRPIRDFIPKLKLFSTEQVSWFRSKNADEYHIYGRPNSTRYVLLDLDKDGEAVVRQMRMDKFALSALVETSAGKFQAWIAVSREDLPVPVATALGKVIAKRYNGDRGSTDALHVGRLPGLRNKKLQYRSGPGDGGPLVLLRVARQGPMIPDGMDKLIRDAERLAATKILMQATKIRLDADKHLQDGKGRRMMKSVSSDDLVIDAGQYSIDKLQEDDSEGDDNV